MAFWQPAASRVTTAPFNSNAASNSGMTAISFDPSGTLTWPSVSRASVAHALTRWRHPVEVAFFDPRTDFPSMAMGTSLVVSRAAVSHRPNAAANAAGSSLANTRSNVSGLGMPLELQEPPEEGFLGPA